MPASFCSEHRILDQPKWTIPTWIKLNVILAAFLLVIPAVILMPVVSLVLHEVDGVVTIVTDIVLKLILLTVFVIGGRARH